MNSKQLQPSRVLARFAHEVIDAPIPRASLERAVLCVLDAVALARCAADQKVAAAVAQFAYDAPLDKPSARLWTDGRRVSALDACLLNGVAAHAQFQDDTDADSGAHPGSMIVPVALALAQHADRPLEAALRGVIAGYVAVNWLGAGGEVRNALLARGFRTSPTLGPIAAAVCAATVLQLTEDQAVNAIGIAADVTGGLLEPVRTGAEDWRIENGTSAWRGGMAGLLASAGVRGPQEPLAGDSGFLRAFAGIDCPASWEHEPEVQTIEKIWFKRYPVLGDNLAVAFAARRLHSQIEDLDAVDKISVEMERRSAEYPGTAYRGPFRSVEQALASTAFTTASILLYGDIQYSKYAERLDDRRIAKLIEKLEVVPRDDYRHLDATVTAFVKGGATTADVREDEDGLFFRDRSAGRDAFERNLRDSGLTADDAPSLLYGWLDGGPEPRIDQLIDIVAGARPIR